MVSSQQSALPAAGRGIIPPLVTPLTAERRLDVPALKALLEHLIKGGVHGVFILGTTGEGPALDYSVREDLIRETCRVCKDRLRVLVGLTDTVLSCTLSLAKVAADAGASAFVVAPPYYFPPAQNELLHYYRTLSKVLPLPFYLYNMPGLTKVSIGEDIIRESLGWKTCLGLKDSSCDMIYYKRALDITKHRPDYRVLIGPEELLAESLLAGGDGGVSGGANLFPELYVGIFNAAERGDYATARKLQLLVIEVSQRLFRAGSYGSPIIQAIKTGLAHIGIGQPVVSEPFLPFDPAVRRVVEEATDDLRVRIREAVSAASARA